MNTWYIAWNVFTFSLQRRQSCFCYDMKIRSDVNITYRPGVTNLRLVSHMRLFERLFVALDKCTQFPFSFLCYYIFKIYYRSICVSKCLLNYWQKIWKTKCNVVTNFISVQVKNDMTYCHQLFTNFKELSGEVDVFRFLIFKFNTHILYFYLDDFNKHDFSIF